MFKEIDKLNSNECKSDNVVIKVFKPGNLVWGTYVSRDILYSILDKGILPSQTTGISQWGKYVDHICFGLLDNSKFPHNYIRSCAMAPKRNYLGNNIGIIINKDSLQKVYGQQLRAVGAAFSGKSRFYPIDWLDKNYTFTFKDKNKYIFDIQVGEPLHLGTGYSPWETEICLYGKSYGKNEFKDIEIPTDFWEGIVVEEDFKNRFSDILDYFCKDKIKNLPIFVLKDRD